MKKTELKKLEKNIKEDLDWALTGNSQEIELSRDSRWMNSSFSIMSIEMLLLGEVQALGELDAELVTGSSKIKLQPRTEEDLKRKRKHLLLSKLWVLGAYELIRFLNDKNKSRSFLREETKEELKNILTIFSSIRVPLAKFQKPGKNKTLYEGIADSFFETDKGVSWRVYIHNKRELEEKVFYRNDLGELLLKFLESVSQDIKKP